MPHSLATGKYLSCYRQILLGSNEYSNAHGVINAKDKAVRCISIEIVDSLAVLGTKDRPCVKGESTCPAITLASQEKISQPWQIS